MKVLFQSISRYQDSIPLYKEMEVLDNSLDKTNVKQLMKEFYEDEDFEFSRYAKFNKSELCWCIWGEEEDTIITALR